ncbi:zinc finger, CCHC-type containing protein [Tanacetum coccineum]
MTTTYRNLRIVLSVEDKLPFLEQPIPAMPVPPAGQVLPPDVLNTHTAWVKASKEIDEHELLQTVREFHACKQEGQSVSSYVLKMKSYIDNLERLSHAMSQNLAVSLILVSLRKEYDNFVQNYNMHGMGKTVTELHAMLKLREQTLPNKEAEKHKNKKPQLAARGSNQGKGKSKLVYAPKPKIPPPPKKDNPSKELRGSRKLKPGALSLYVGDGHRAAIEAIGSYHLCLPSGLVLVLHNCHYAPSITRGIILVSCLYDNGFINRFENNTISVSRNNVVYFSVVPRNGIFEIDLSKSNTNDSSMYAISNKRSKINLDSTLFWHYRLGHISKKRIEKLQHYGLLNSIDN